MARKKKRMSGFLEFVGWVVGIVVALAIGNGLITGTLSVPFVAASVANPVGSVAGWILVISAIIGLVMRVVSLFRK